MNDEYKVLPGRLLPLLIKAREILSDPKAWMKGSYAATALGKPTRESNPDACKFCSIGAVMRANGAFDMALENELGRQLQSFIGSSDYYGVPPWNDADERTHGDILEFFDTTISILKGQVK